MRRVPVIPYIVAVLFALCAPLCMSAEWHDDLRICENNPDSPARRKCEERLLPHVREVALHSPKLDTGWLSMFISYCDILGIHDRDYEKAKAMVPIVTKGEEIRRHNERGCDGGFWKLAGYYNSLGAEWGQWSKKAKEVGDFSCSQSANSR